MRLTKYQRLKISTNILSTTVRELGKQWQVNPQTIQKVCDGTITSARLESLIDETINRAENKFWDYLQSQRINKVKGKEKQPQV